MKRVVSLLPSATELLCLIPGGQNLLVGRNHEDDYPKSIAHLPVLTGQRTVFTTMEDVDRQVSEALSKGNSLYTLDEELLKELKPDVILTQSLCDVCAIEVGTVYRIAKKMSPQPEVVTLNPVSIEDVLQDVVIVGSAVGLESEAQAVKASLAARIKSAADFAEAKLAAAGGVRPNVLFAEWPTPLYPGGHWTSQLIRMAGGHQPLNPPTRPDGAAGPSVRIPVEKALDAPLDSLIICPCGIDLPKTKLEMEKVRTDPQYAWWTELEAKASRIVQVDGNQYFNRSGPRLVESFEWLVGWLWKDYGRIPKGFEFEDFKG